MTTSIADLLVQLDAPGSFATRLRAPAEDLEIEVKGVGPLRFPITQRVAQKLRSVARPSPFGLREQTLHDPQVRNGWEVAASRVKIAARRWKPALATHLRALQAELGIPEECELKAVFDKLLLYEAGQFFKPHQDSERSDDMVATLVVVLPSEYSGGSLHVEQRGEKKSFHRLKSQSKELSLLAFYADCHHEVGPVSKGVRVALTYHLLLAGRSQGVALTTAADLVDRLTERVREHFSVPVADRNERSEPRPHERLVYLLDHEYTQRSLSWSHLKNGDRVRVAALRKVAEGLDCVSYLALAEVHEVWTAAEPYVDEYPFRRHGRRYWDFRDDDDLDDDQDDDQYELHELQESTIELSHWLDADGKLFEGALEEVSSGELHFTKPSVDMDPFKSEYEGYQGNYGNTADRWYHRAALVMWPRENTFALQAQVSAPWAVDQLLALSRSNTTELEAKIRKVLPSWARAAGGVASAGFFAKLVKLSTRIEDAKLAYGWLAPVGAHRLRTRTARRDLAKLVDKHGLSWGKELFTEWTEKASWRTPNWAPLLADICEDLCSSKRAPCEALAKWLVDREIETARKRCVDALTERQAWLDLDAFSDEATHLAHVLAAAAVMSESGVVEDAIRLLLGDKPCFPVSFLVQVLRKSVARSPALRAHLAGSALHRRCVEELEGTLHAPARARGDWSIAYPLACSCSDCKVLAQFLSSGREDLDWPLSKERRRHIHGVIGAAKLPVLHTTLRQGRPYVLQLRKDGSLFSREDDYRKKVKAILRELPRLRAR